MVRILLITTAIKISTALVIENLVKTWLALVRILTPFDHQIFVTFRNNTIILILKMANLTKSLDYFLKVLQGGLYSSLLCCQFSEVLLFEFSLDHPVF